MKRYFISGIGTEIGKTIASSVLTEAWQADYWKPVQSGDLHHTDSMKVRDLISNSRTRIFPEGYRLNTPASPHLSARLDGIEIDLEAFEVPETNNTLIIEGAGGLLVPLNDSDLIIDLVPKFEAEIILVISHYLGSINHSLLSLEAIRARKLPLAGVVWCGQPNPESEAIIGKMSDIEVLGRVDFMKEINRENVRKQSLKFKKELV